MLKSTPTTGQGDEDGCRQATQGTGSQGYELGMQRTKPIAHMLGDHFLEVWIRVR